jgi:large subunit ribosomal protein L28
MSVKRKVTAAKPQFGNNVSFSQRKTRRQFKPNMQSKRIYSPELKRTVRIRVSVKELRTIDKIGLTAYLKMRGVKVQDLVRE